MPVIHIWLEIDDAIILPSRLSTSSSTASEVSELAMQVSTLLRYTSDSLSVTSELSQNFHHSKTFQTILQNICDWSCPIPADIAKLIAQANEAIQAADTLWQHKDGVGLETLIKPCKGVCAIRAELVEQHPTAVIGNPKAEDMVFRIKQVFKCIQTIHSKGKKRAAALANAIAIVTTPAEPTPTKPQPLVAKPKLLKCCCLAKSKAIVKDLSDKEASIVTATEEDTVMATIRHKADTIISCFEWLNINEDINVIVNCDLAAGNIIEGHKVPLPKCLTNKKAAQREKEKAEQRVEAIQAAKRPHASADLAFKDSPYTIAAADLAINNEASQSTIDAAASLVIAGDHINPSESILCSREADLCNDVITTTHKIEYLLKYREFVVAHHGQVIKQLESHLPVPIEADSSAPVASGSKIN
ncbi:uncharacterized protein ARMOST_21636 [Armillaria ostoyae]|uniref:Uncharacterized protein n=1 Tax=Armillaria ostoyae TaxID=47428 RepID=A0A284SAM4_ARMOS|nr:uncharacterized protein ARMOST_21636 [Armillaria ostoyae]